MKVTPSKALSVPKRELESAIIGTRLLKTVQKETKLNLKIHETIFGQTVEWFLIGLLRRGNTNCLSPTGSVKYTHLQNPFNGII